MRLIKPKLVKTCRPIWYFFLMKYYVKISMVSPEAKDLADREETP
jgi:hypothetical protein